MTKKRPNVINVGRTSFRRLSTTGGQARAYRAYWLIWPTPNGWLGSVVVRA